MNWVTTTYGKRSALVEKLRQGASQSCIRGNLVWTIENSSLFAYEIRKAGKVWEYKKINETELTNTQISCPVSYLKKSDIQNPNWRKELVEESKANKNLKRRIENDFNKAKASKLRLVIHVNTKTQGQFLLTVESLVPLTGRHLNGKLYRIPLRRITSWQIR